MATLQEHYSELKNKYSKEISFAESLFTTSPARFNEELLSTRRQNIIAEQVNSEHLYLDGKRPLSFTEAYNIHGLKEGVDLTTPSATTPVDMGAWKIFATQVAAAVAVNTICDDLVSVIPMANRKGTFNYLQYEYGTTRGNITAGERFSDYTGLGTLPEGYTGSNTFAKETIGEGGASTYELKGAVVGIHVVSVDHGVLYPDTDYTVESTNTSTIITFSTALDEGQELYVSYTVALADKPHSVEPARLSAKINEVWLEAELHEIAVDWTLYASFIAEKDRDVDLAASLTNEAANVVALEQDNAVIRTLGRAALDKDSGNFIESARINEAPLAGVDILSYNQVIASKIARLDKELFKRTKMRRGTALVCGSEWMTIFPVLPGFTANKVVTSAGNYLAGTYQGKKVYVVCDEEFEYSFFEVIRDNATVCAILGKYMDFTAGMLHSRRGVQEISFFTAYAIQLINPSLLVGSELYTDTTEASTQPIYVKIVSDSTDTGDAGDGDPD